MGKANDDDMRAQVEHEIADWLLAEYETVCIPTDRSHILEEYALGQANAFDHCEAIIRAGAYRKSPDAEGGGEHHMGPSFTSDVPAAPAEGPGYAPAHAVRSTELEHQLYAAHRRIAELETSPENGLMLQLRVQQTMIDGYQQDLAAANERIAELEAAQARMVEIAQRDDEDWKGGRSVRRNLLRALGVEVK